MVSDELRKLAAMLADWAADAPACTVYVFGSHVRGDYHAGSDIDLYLSAPTLANDDTTAWLFLNLTDDFSAIKAKLPAVRILEDSPEVVEEILAAPIIHTDRNVRCVWVPSGPKKPPPANSS